MAFASTLKPRSLFVMLMLLLAGCSSTSSTSTSQYYYTDSWWHDDYWFYQDHVYPDCCHTDGEFKQAVTSWWHTLDPEKQQEIKDKVDGWKEGNGPDIPALKNDFQAKFDSLPPEKQQEITAKRDAIRQQMSDSNPQVLPANLKASDITKEKVISTGQNLTFAQKQQIKNRWQSKERPTLNRPTRPNLPQTRPARPTPPMHTGARPNIPRPDFNRGGMRGRAGGKR